MTAGAGSDAEMAVEASSGGRSRLRGLLRWLRRWTLFSSLQRRIIFFNLIGLAMLVAGMTYLTSNRQHLIGIYVDALRKQGEIIAIGISESAVVKTKQGLVFDPIKTATVLSRLARPTDVRIRLYDQTRRLMTDSYFLTPDGPPATAGLSDPLRTASGTGMAGRFERVINRIAGYISDRRQFRHESPIAGISSDEEVIQASLGQISHKVGVTVRNEAVVSVAMPVVHEGMRVGVLQLSTLGGEVDRLVREELTSVLEIFFLAAIVSVLLSILLANMIATPIRLLASSANIVGSKGNRPLTPDKPEIPDLTHRADEIGELSDALIRMTSALYHRIGANESFAADVAHEIKNPLTSLRSAVETMQFARTRHQQQQLLDVIQNDVRRMDRLVTDISNASRLDAEMVRERMQPFDLGELIEAMASVIQAEGKARGVRVYTKLPPGPFMGLGLENRVAQIVTNLLMNALSFSPDKSRITVTGTRLGDSTIRVAVEDQGPGVPEENLESVFERFYSERPDSEDFGNHSGLGLSISKQIVDGHGGRIWVENIPDPKGGTKPAGARFVFELPA